MMQSERQSIANDMVDSSKLISERINGTGKNLALNGSPMNGSIRSSIAGNKTENVANRRNSGIV